MNKKIDQVTLPIKKLKYFNKREILFVLLFIFIFVFVIILILIFSKNKIMDMNNFVRITMDRISVFFNFKKNKNENKTEKRLDIISQASSNGLNDTSEIKIENN